MTRPPNIAADDPRHGQYAGAVAHWFAGERPCDDCARAEWRYRKARHLRHLRGDSPTVPSFGTVRRIRALHALGWTGPQIADVAGVSVNTMRAIVYHGSQVIRSHTARKIAVAYERLSMTRPEGHYANRARAMARRKGWLPPLAWDDIDDPGEKPRPQTERRLYRSAELASEWDHLRRCGVSIDAAARQLGVSVGAIEKAAVRARREVAA